MPRWGQIAIFFSIMLSVTASIHYYLWVRLVRDTVLPAPWSRVLTVAIAALGVSMPLSFFVMRVLGRRTFVLWPVYLWMGFMFFIFMGLLSGELVRIVALAMSKLGGTPADPERRQFLARAIAGGAAAVSGTLGALSVRSAIGPVEIREQEVKLARLPKALDGFRLVQLSDVHIGPTIGRAFIEQVVERVNSIDADLVAITGDLVDSSVERLRDAVVPLANIKSKHGVFFVTGNHEYYVDTDEWMAELKRLGIRVLRNERVSIGSGEHSFDLAGVDDWSAGRIRPDHGHNLEGAVAGRDPAREHVLLEHQPRAITDADKHGVGLMLSGHTHDGQIWPFKYLVALTQPYMQGLNRHSAATQIYVSRGTGYWGPPMRLRAPAEVTKLVLRAV
jgi:predicted MPP superfamily phosphohydrolase